MESTGNVNDKFTDSVLVAGMVSTTDADESNTFLGADSGSTEVDEDC